MVHFVRKPLALHPSPAHTMPGESRARQKLCTELAAQARRLRGIGPTSDRTIIVASRQVARRGLQLAGPEVEARLLSAPGEERLLPPELVEEAWRLVLVGEDPPRGPAGPLEAEAVSG